MNVLEVRDLDVRFFQEGAEVHAVKSASFTLAKGEWVAILGSSGSGKSTLLHLLGLLDECDADSGGVWFDGKPVADLKFSARNHYRNESVGFVFQFYHLLPELSTEAKQLRSLSLVLPTPRLPRMQSPALLPP